MRSIVARSATAIAAAADLPLATSALRVGPLAALLVVGALFAGTSPARATTETFNEAGGEQTFTVPPGIFRVHVVVDGESGENLRSFSEYGPGRGGRGAQVVGELNVTPGETLYAEPGAKNGGCSASVCAGGSSDVRTAPREAGLSPDDRLIVAGGGGGPSEGGRNGGDANQAGEDGFQYTQEGHGPLGGGGAGTQLAGGAGGSGCEASPRQQGEDGELGRGGEGGAESKRYVEETEDENTRGYPGTGGGGGGGYYGGGGGGGACSFARKVVGDPGSGGGGSSLVPEGGEQSLLPLETAPEVLISYDFGAPSVSGLSPNEGPEGGGSVVMVRGEGLDTADSVRFGSTDAMSFTINSATSITAVAPPGAGNVDVTVTADGQSSASTTADQFAYRPVPAITSVTPANGPRSGGTTVTITGSGFSNATAVQFGAGPARSYTVNSPTSITAVSPEAENDTVHVRVTTAGGTSVESAGDQFYYRAPTVSGISRRRGPSGGGKRIRIVGSNFDDVTDVRFGSTAATSFTVKSPSSIWAVLPPGTGTVDITVATTHGTSEPMAVDQFTYRADKPTVTALNPDHGPIAGGTTVTVSGSGFALGNGTAFKFGTISGVNGNCPSTTSCTVTTPAAKKREAAVVDVVAAVGRARSKKTTSDMYTYG